MVFIHLQTAPIYIEYKTLCHVVTSLAKCETAAVFHNAQTAIHIRYILQQLGHSQPPTPIILDKSTSENFIKNNITQKRSESCIIGFVININNENLISYKKIHNSTLLIIILNIFFQQYIIVKFAKLMYVIFLNKILSYVAS